MYLFVFLLGQLREQLSYLKGDNFFRFTCSDCSEDGKEQYERLKLTWQQVSKSSSSRVREVGLPQIYWSKCLENEELTYELLSCFEGHFFTMKIILNMWRKEFLVKLLTANLAYWV